MMKEAIGCLKFVELYNSSKLYNSRREIGLPRTGVLIVRLLQLLLIQQIQIRGKLMLSLTLRIPTS
jgi:hypothetical protein